ncbi:MAG: ROK family protein [Baekduia sp.]
MSSNTATIGVDVGGTKVAVARLDGTTLSEPVTEPTVLTSTEELLAQLTRMITSLGPADAVGIGLPSAVDHETGTVRDSVNIPLADVAIRDLLSERLGGVPVAVANDAQLAGLGEAWDDDLHLVSDSLIMFTVGTGVGGAIVLGGEIYHGAGGGAGHFGHQLVAVDMSRDDPPHTPGYPQPGTLESIAAGRELDELARAIGLEDGRALVAAAKAGEPGAADAIERLGRRLGLGIANAINMFDPREIVIGGGVSAAGNMLLEPAARIGRRFAAPGLGTRTTIRLARHGTYAGARGAALLARRA